MSLPNSEEHFAIDPAVPEWVEDRGELPESTSSDEPASVLLSDDQIDTASGCAYRRGVQRLNSPQGVQACSQVELPFDPATQRLTVHSIAVLRGGERREAATDRGQFRMLQRETSLEKQIYDGAISAVLLVEDVRVGDVLDVSYTIEEHDSAFPGRQAMVIPLGHPFHVGARHVTVRASAAAKVAVTDGAEQLQKADAGDGTAVWRWSRTDLAPLEPDPGAPPWVLQVTLLQVSEFSGWDEVASMTAARWEEALASGGETPEFDQLLDEIRQLPGAADRAEAAIRFVQNEIRYLGLEEGIHSFIPESPARVFGRRFGDCKDKALLLCHLLRRLGISADPVLVNEEIGRSLPELLPSPKVFNHVIARYELDGEHRFVDATISGQGGSEGRRLVPNFGMGLPIDAGGGGLVELPALHGAAGDVAVVERFVIGSKGEQTRLEVEFVASGIEADILRHAIGAEGRSGAEKHFGDIYKELYPGATRTGDLQREDEREQNVLTLREEYLIPEFARKAPGGRRFYGVSAHTVGGRLVGSPEEERDKPLGLPFPNYVRQTIRVVPPKNVQINPEKVAVDSPSFRFDFGSSQSRGEIVLEYSYQNKADIVPADEFKPYMEKLEEVASSLGFGIPAGGGISRVWIILACLLIGFSLGPIKGCLKQLGKDEPRRRSTPAQFATPRAPSYEISIPAGGFGPSPRIAPTPEARPGGIPSMAPGANPPGATISRPDVPSDRPIPGRPSFPSGPAIPGGPTTPSFSPPSLPR